MLKSLNYEMLDGREKTFVIHRELFKIIIEQDDLEICSGCSSYRFDGKILSLSRQRLSIFQMITKGNILEVPLLCLVASQNSKGRKTTNSNWTSTPLRPF